MAAEMKSKKSIAVIGASGHGRVVADCVRVNADMQFMGFFDDNLSLHPVGKVDECESYKNYSYVVGIGDAGIREGIVNEHQLKWATVIHPSAIVSPSAEIGEGTVVMPGAIINAGAKIGRHCIINSGAIVEHDNVIEDFAHISVGAKLGGNVHVGKRTWIGIGAVVRNSISICADCMIGAGAVVVKDVKQCGIYAGIPVDVLKLEKFESACGSGGFQKKVLG